MKKLYRRGTVHPTPPAVSDQLLSFLPAAILTLAATLSQEEREVLAYLISCSSSNSQPKKTPSAAGPGGSKGGAADHPVCFGCYCFRCYISYWVKWDSSPNRQLIHEIIDAFEESLVKESRKEKNRRERRKGKNVVKGEISLLELDATKKSEPSLAKQDFNFTESQSPAEHGGGNSSREEEEEGENGEEEEELEKGSVRKFVSFLGERLWSVWG